MENPEPTKKAFLVQTFGFWGRGPTLRAAAFQLKKAGAIRNSFVTVDLVVGDETPSITNHGLNVEFKEKAQSYRIGSHFRLGQLLALAEES